MSGYICSRCGNEDIKYFGINKKGIYCRRCIKFNGSKASENQIGNTNVNIELDFELTKEQKRISFLIDKAYKERKNILLCAVCGAGKTELVYKVITSVLKEGKRVGFVIPRKDVVIDLFPRISKVFKNNRVIAVYGGHHQKLEGDIIILTSHQLYRYTHYFDFLIMDEADAFPFYNNPTLKMFFKKSLKGNFLMMSATSLKEMEQDIKKENGIILKLHKRYHGHPLPVPKLVKCLFFKEVCLLYYFARLYKLKKPIFVFCPTINCCEKIFKLLNVFFKKGDFVHSKKEIRDKIISDFKVGALQYLVTTSILERGVTIKDLQVIIYDSSHVLFDEKTLVQIAGRVGRKEDAYTGEVLFIGEYISKSMEEAKRNIERSNSY